MRCFCTLFKRYNQIAMFQTADQQYQDAFNDELESFKARVRVRGKIRIEKALKEYEEEERQKRLGPGGIDPVEVYETLPEVSAPLPSGLPEPFGPIHSHCIRVLSKG